MNKYPPRLAHAVAALLVVAGCVDCEPCGKYSFVLFASDQTLPAGSYHIDIILDDTMASCDVDTSINDHADCSNDEIIELILHDDAVDLSLPTMTPAHIEVRVAHLDTGNRWLGTAEVALRPSPGEPGCPTCSYGYAEAALTIDN